ncbi:ATP-binding cassette domain-containing protein [Bifidobacterium bifidum]|uniref:ATP-binding cassette domain-containing protein n=1 Tax=Bifidobacterium bifidum TaxID=1681 RepID=UPI0006C19917|nr:ATP-binding cassette domain-containing protein [Bifidobacterium bifidum]CUN18596.1 ABC transporter ATP-binding protein [Bifidobacterium bifidum]
MRVDLDHVGHRYADGPLLFHDLTASLMPGHVYALTGPSGAGKSTLLGCLCSMVLRPVERLVFSPKER